MDYVLHGLSYANMTLYGASLPSYRASGKTDAKEGKDEIINGDDPASQAAIDRLFDETDRR